MQFPDLLVRELTLDKLTLKLTLDKLTLKSINGNNWFAYLT